MRKKTSKASLAKYPPIKQAIPLPKKMLKAKTLKDMVLKPSK